MTEERQPDEVLRKRAREFDEKTFGHAGEPCDRYIFAAAFAQSNCEMQDEIASIVSAHRTDWTWEEVVKDVRNLRDALTATQQARAEEQDARKSAEQQLAEARAQGEELLEALKNLLGVYQKLYDEGEKTPAIRRAEAAIAKLQKPLATVSNSGSWDANLTGSSVAPAKEAPEPK